jgi:hypothetical protein
MVCGVTINILASAERIWSLHASLTMDTEALLRRYDAAGGTASSPLLR